MDGFGFCVRGLAMPGLLFGRGLFVVLVDVDVRRDCAVDVLSQQQTNNT